MILWESVIYETVGESLYSDELGSYSSFGIRGRDASGREVIFCSDISSDEDFVISLCDKCNQLQVSPVHLLDVVKDSL